MDPDVLFKTEAHALIDKRPWFDAVEGGLRKYEHLLPANALDNTRICWGWQHGRHFFNHRYKTLVVERGYLGKRRHECSLGWNGLNGRATFYPKDDPSRFDKSYKLSPWKTTGDCIVICGQVKGDQSLEYQDLTSWYEQIASEFSCHGLPVYFKSHPDAPRGRNFTPRLKSIDEPMSTVLGHARCLVAWNSNSAVDAVIAGVPAYTGDRGSMAWDVTSHSPRDIICPERELWAHRLAWCQWTPEEIANGDWVPQIFKINVEQYEYV